MTLLPLCAILLLPVESPANEAHDTCTGYEDWATEIMTARQNGVAMSRAMELLDEHVEGEGPMELLSALVIQAYDQPRYNSSGSFQENAIQEFADASYGFCLKVFRNAS